MKRAKKSQTEIMGLAIVVILLVVGMTFVIKFMMSREQVDYKTQFTHAEIASNTLNTFLKTKSQSCNELSMTELLQDCSQSKSIYCQNGENSCDYSEETAKFIFSQTLEEWNKDYEFKVFRQEEDPIINLGERCPGNKKSKTFPIPTSSGTLSVKLDVCG